MQDTEENHEVQAEEAIDTPTQEPVEDGQPVAVGLAAEGEVTEGPTAGAQNAATVDTPTEPERDPLPEEPDADAAPQLSAEAVYTNADQKIEHSEPGFLHRAVSQNGLAITEISIDAKPGLIGEQNTLDKGELLTVNSDGSYSYDPNGAYDDLPAGETVVASALVLTVVDTSNQMAGTMLVSVSVHGVNESVDKNPAQTLRATVNQTEDKRLNLLEMSGAARLDAKEVTLVKINGAAFAGSIPFMLPGGAKVTASGDGRFFFEPNSCLPGECVITFTVDVDGEETTLDLSIEVKSV